jgi:cation diffusion facilitator CzcD-associated flavoprotein CzcO
VTKRVAVIGAGPAGLVAVRELRRAGLEAVAFEADAQLGGTWHYTEDVESDPLGGDLSRRRILSSMYASLRTNLPRDLMAFRDYPFDTENGDGCDARRFPGHSTVLAYLQHFAAAFDLRSSIRFSTRVMQISREQTEDDTARTRWTLESRNETGAKRETFDGVAVCNGHFTVPVVPELPGMDRFTGTLTHSHNYRRPARFTDQRVVLLGAKSSGIDLSLELSTVCRDVHLCARGIETTTRPSDERRLWLSPNIARFDDSAVVLEDGSRLEDVDAVVFCTGYRYSFPFLSGAPGVIDVGDRWVHPLYLDLLAAREPTLALVGMPNMIIPFPLFEAQARYFAATLSGRVTLPALEERLTAVETHEAGLAAAGIPQNNYLRHHERQYDYMNDLSRRVGAPPLPTNFADVHRVIASERNTNPSGFRDKTYPAL